jgi:ribosomal-protein-alanine N-acetyltransferase
MVTLKTERLVLREFTMDDYEAAHAYASDPRVVEYMSFGPNTPEDTRSFLERAIEKRRQRPRTGYTLALTIGGELIGGCGLTVTDAKLGEGEIGYCMRPEFWGRGIGTEAAGALIGFGFKELDLYRIIAKCDPMNVASWRVMEKNGMRREGRLRENVVIRGERRDSLLYSILKHEYSG